MERWFEHDQVAKWSAQHHLQQFKSYYIVNFRASFLKGISKNTSIIWRHCMLKILG